MASIRVKYLGNEGGYAVVLYGGKTYYCRANALGQNLVVNQMYNVDHTELFAR